MRTIWKIYSIGLRQSADGSDDVDDDQASGVYSGAGTKRRCNADEKIAQGVCTFGGRRGM